MPKTKGHGGINPKDTKIFSLPKNKKDPNHPDDLGYHGGQGKATPPAGILKTKGRKRKKEPHFGVG